MISFNWVTLAFNEWDNTNGLGARGF